ncbi:DUF4352 domain-containing protein [Mycetocola sp. 2940]|uniref:DUF4352 domain-containing protein n=1 Tax=Mycetocola sp. 2940 TaxID=3156452 RepID=UPI003399BCE9
MRATAHGGIPEFAALAVAVVVSLSVLTGCTTSGAPEAGPTSSPTSEPSTDATPEPARTTPVPAPDGGTIEDIIEPAPEPEQIKADLGDVAVLDSDVTISAPDVAEIDVEAHTPGETAGPALAVTIRIENDSAADLDVETVMVTLLDAAGAAASPTTADPARPFAGSIPPGGSADGVYVFLVPEGARDPIELTIAYSAGVPVVLLVGDASQ